MSTCKAKGYPLMAEKLANILALYDPELRDKAITYEGVIPLQEGSIATVLAMERIADGGEFVPGFALGLGKSEVKKHIRNR